MVWLVPSQTQAKLIGWVRRDRPWIEWLWLVSVMLHLFLCTYLYFAYVQPWISGEINVRIGADSDRYWDAAKSIQSSSRLGDLISLGGSFLAPVTLITLLRNGFLILCFNMILFGIAIRLAGSIPQVSKPIFGLLMLMSPELIPALVTVNKEILTLLAAVLTARYLYSIERPKLLLFITLVVAAFARWEQALILLLALLLGSGPFRKRRAWALVFLIMFIAVAYPLAFRLLGIDPSVFDWLLAGANTIVKLDQFQMAYGFPLVVLPKIAMLLGGTLLQPSFYSTGQLAIISVDPQQGLFGPLASGALLFVLVCMLLSGRLRLSRPVVFLSAVTTIVTAAIPFIQPRYLYGVYVMCCIDLARPAELREETRQPNRRLFLAFGHKVHLSFLTPSPRQDIAGEHTPDLK